MLKAIIMIINCVHVKANLHNKAVSNATVLSLFVNRAKQRILLTHDLTNKQKKNHVSDNRAVYKNTLKTKK